MKIPLSIFTFIGKLLWFSGAPGMGKSTSAQLLARENDYVYYEADAFNMMLNPFNPLDSENPSVETLKQKVLKGPGAAERSQLGKYLTWYLDSRLFFIHSRLIFYTFYSSESIYPLGKTYDWTGI